MRERQRRLRNGWRGLGLGLAILIPAASVASAALAADAGPPAAPTTRVLAIGEVTALGASDARRAVMPQEVRQTVRLYLQGKIDQWYVRKDGKGVVFILNTDSVDTARAELEQLPLGQAKMMTFELIPLGPLSPLAMLLPPPAP